MTDKTNTDDLLFEALTPLGFRVRVSRAYWQLITTIEHPVMTGRESDVRGTLESPDEIRLSRSDPAVYLFAGRIARVIWSVPSPRDWMGRAF